MGLAAEACAQKADRDLMLVVLARLSWLASFWTEDLLRVWRVGLIAVFFFFFCSRMFYNSVSISGVWIYIYAQAAGLTLVMCGGSLDRCKRTLAIRMMGNQGGSYVGTTSEISLV